MPHDTEMQSETPPELAALAHDLNLCDIGIAITKGGRRRQFVAHRKACYAHIHAMNVQDGMDGLSDDELLAELMG